MQWRDLVIDGYGRGLDLLTEALEGLTTADLDRQPHPDCNSMGWISWHLARVQDAEIAGVMGAEQLWTKEGWCARFNRPADPDDTGYGHTSAQVADFKSPGVETLLAYYRAVLDRSKGYLASMRASELSRELDEPWYQPLPTVAVRIVSVMADCLVHVGEVSYLRGLLKGKGWST